MEKKIDLAELLRDCPKGMKLDCVLFNNPVTLDKITDTHKVTYPIAVTTVDGHVELFNKYGHYLNRTDAKCVIFPMGKTTWKGFVPPCKFKAGDILVCETGTIVLFSHIDSNGFVYYHCIIPTYRSFRIEEIAKVGVGKYYHCVLANEQQRQRMYDEIKCSGYKYNQSTNKIEKLVEPKFKVGDVIVNNYRKHLNGDTRSWKIHQITNDKYIFTDGSLMYIQDQNNWVLNTARFDITTLKPFDKVLARCSTLEKWRIQFFEKYDKTYSYPFICLGCINYKQCIPYEDNEHLLDTADDCDEYFKTWR